MGYAYYVLPDGREAGYGVTAACDKSTCTAEIDRGMSYLCGEWPDGHRGSDAPGCGRYFCGDHEHKHDCPKPACGEYPHEDEQTADPCNRIKGHDGAHADDEGVDFILTESDEE